MFTQVTHNFNVLRRELYGFWNDIQRFCCLSHQLCTHQQHTKALIRVGRTNIRKSFSFQLTNPNALPHLVLNSCSAVYCVGLGFLQEMGVSKYEDVAVSTYDEFQYIYLKFSSKTMEKYGHLFKDWFDLLSLSRP